MRSPPKIHASRTVAICRIGLILALAVSYAAENRSFPVPGPAAYAGVSAYLLYAMMMLVFAWRHWWADHQLRYAAFVIDTAASLAILIWVEGSGQGLISPFMVFFIFLMITATLLWRTSLAATAALAILAAYVAVGLLINAQGAMSEPGGFSRRLVFMAVIGGFIIWYGRLLSRPVPQRLDWPLDASIDAQMEVIREFVRQHIRCAGVAVAWTPDEEPWVHLARAGTCGEQVELMGPDAINLHNNPATPLLFDRARNCGLWLQADDRIVAVRSLPPCVLAEHLDIATGICAPIQSRTGRGSIVLTGIQALTGEHLRIAAALSEEIGFALDRHHMAWVIRNAEAEHLQQAIARDLHDTIAQSLAGASFRLEALRQEALAGRPVAQDLALVQQSLAREGLLVERLIGQLRDRKGKGQPGTMMDVATALADNADNWGIIARFESEEGMPALPPGVELELHQLLREAVANAVRHGQADTVSLALSLKGDHLQADFTDNGTGFAETASSEGDAAIPPPSIQGRVYAAGGTMKLTSRPGHTCLSILLPMGHSR